MFITSLQIGQKKIRMDRIPDYKNQQIVTDSLHTRVSSDGVWNEYYSDPLDDDYMFQVTYSSDQSHQCSVSIRETAPSGGELVLSGHVSTNSSYSYNYLSAIIHKGFYIRVFWIKSGDYTKPNELVIKRIPFK